MADDDFIVAPPWIAPPPAAAPPPPPEQKAETPVIVLPPGMAEAVALKLPPERQRTPPAKPDVTFFPGGPGGIGAPLPAAPAPPAAPPPPPPVTQASPVAPPAPPLAPAVPQQPVQAAPPPPPPAPPAPPAAPAPPVPVAAWTLTLEDGIAVPVAGAVYLGRNPSASAEHPAAATLAINDPRKSISKTHALLVVSGASVTLTDLHSTNGTAVLRDGAAESILEPGVPVALAAGTTFELGEYTVRLAHG